MATEKQDFSKSTNPISTGEKLFSPAKIKEFTFEVKNEFHKIVWPDKKHTIASTGVVIILVSLISFYLGAVDLILGKIITSILK